MEDLLEEFFQQQLEEGFVLPYKIANKVRVFEYKSFRDMLSSDAKAIYDKPLINSTLEEILECSVCGARASVTELRLLGGVADQRMLGLITEAGKTYGEVMRAKVCSDKIHKDSAPVDGPMCSRLVRGVGFMGQTFKITMPALAVRDLSAIGNEFQIRARSLADAFNLGVQKGWIRFGMLARCSVMPLAVHGMGLPFHMFVFPVMDTPTVSHDDWNTMFKDAGFRGGKIFYREGEV